MPSPRRGGMLLEQVDQVAPPAIHCNRRVYSFTSVSPGLKPGTKCHGRWDVPDWPPPVEDVAAAVSSDIWIYPLAHCFVSNKSQSQCRDDVLLTPSPKQAFPRSFPSAVGQFAPLPMLNWKRQLNQKENFEGKHASHSVTRNQMGPPDPPNPMSLPCSGPTPFWHHQDPLILNLLIWQTNQRHKPCCGHMLLKSQYIYLLYIYIYLVIW